jgi:hypothetical protein
MALDVLSSKEGDRYGCRLERRARKSCSGEVGVGRVSHLSLPAFNPGMSYTVHMYYLNLGLAFKTKKHKTAFFRKVLRIIKSSP